MPTRNVVLTDHQSQINDQLVTSGRYQNASEDLRLVERRQSEDEMRLLALRDAAALGLADMAKGRFISFDSADALGVHLTTLSSDAINAS